MQFDAISPAIKLAERILSLPLSLTQGKTAASGLYYKWEQRSKSRFLKDPEAPPKHIFFSAPRFSIFLTQQEKPLDLQLYSDDVVQLSNADGSITQHDNLLTIPDFLCKSSAYPGPLET